MHQPNRLFRWSVPPLPQRRLLLRRNSGSARKSCFEILVALVEHAGEVVEKNSLMTRAWSDVTVEESNLRAQITALRRVLAEGVTGENYVITLPGRGYRFVAAVAKSTSDTAQPATATCNRHNFPDRLTRPIGRADIVAMVSSRLQRGRFVTIVGSAGSAKLQLP
jgi:DNA-binding winged helix-turn-helix (wHTH) protein